MQRPDATRREGPANALPSRLEQKGAIAGFALTARRAPEVVVLARPVDEEHGGVLALLADGEAWSSSALAIALGSSQRTVRRALDVLAAAGKVDSFGRGRARRWMAPPVAVRDDLVTPRPAAN